MCIYVTKVIINLFFTLNNVCYVLFFFFSLLFFFMMRVLGSSKSYHVCSTEGASRPLANHRAVILMHPCSFSLMLSYTSVAKVTLPEPPYPVGVSMNYLPFYRLRFHTFLLCLFPVVILFAHTHVCFTHATISLTTTLKVRRIPVGTHDLFRTGVHTSFQY